MKTTASYHYVFLFRISNRSMRL